MGWESKPNCFRICWMLASWYAIAGSPPGRCAGVLKKTFRPATPAFPTSRVMMLRITATLCGSWGLSTPPSIGRRVSTWKTSAKLCASLPVTTSSPPNTSWNTPSRCSRLCASLEYGIVMKAVGYLLDSGSPRSVERCGRSEEHTSELQSPMYLVCRLLLGKKEDAWVPSRLCDARRDKLLRSTRSPSWCAHRRQTSKSAPQSRPRAGSGLGRRFFFNDTATPEIYTLSLHDALPIWLSDLSPRVFRPPMVWTASSVSDVPLCGGFISVDRFDAWPSEIRWDGDQLHRASC